MEPIVNKDQNPPHGGSFVRKADGRLEQLAGTSPAPDTTATSPKSDDTQPKPATVASAPVRAAEKE